MMDSQVQGAILSAQQFMSNRNDTTVLIQLENKLDSLNAVSQDWALSNVSAVAQWTDENLMLIEWFTYCHNLLASVEPIPISLSQKVVAFLTNFAWYNPQARQYFQSQLNLAPTLSLCILRHINHQPHINVLFQCLKLFQIVTYKSPAVQDLMNIASTDLLLFLIKAVCRRKPDDSTDQMRYSLGILNNLCTNSGAVKEFMKRTDLMKDLFRTLLALLQDSNRDVVINCLSIIMMLDDNLKDKVFNSRNLPHTFQCAFNVLLKGDQFMARHYAVDLFIRMVGSSSIRDALAGYKSLEQSMVNVCSLLVNLDTKREPFYKVYDLLLRFSKMDVLRGPTCRAIMRAGPIDDRLISPIVAVIECARSLVEQSAFPDLPCRAMKLLKFVVEEIVGSGHRLADYVSTDVLLQIIEECLKTTIETGRPYLAAHKSKRIVHCLRLATVSSRDDPEFRTDLLEVVTAPLCGHLAEFQMLSNPIVSFTNANAAVSSERSHSTKHESKELWHAIGAQILFSLMDFLRLQEDYSNSHREQYWRMLTDIRMVPFVAYGLTCQNKKLVAQALRTVMAMAQDDQFPLLWLCELISQNIKNLEMKPSWNSCRNGDGYGGSLSTNFSGSKTSVDSCYASNGNASSGITNTIDSGIIDELITNMKSTLNVNDPKLSQIMEVFERKISMMEAKERQLQAVIIARTNALQQSDRLVNQYRLNRNDVESETGQLRHLLRETELKHEQSVGASTLLNGKIEKLQSTVKALEKLVEEKNEELDICREMETDLNLKLKSMNDEKETLKREIESEKEMHDVVRKHYDKMKESFELTYVKLTDAENELKQSKKICKDQEASIKTLSEKNEELKSALNSKDEEINELECSVEKLQDTLQQSDKEKKHLHNQLTESERESNRKTGLIKEQERTIQKLNEEVASYAKILESMHKLSAKAVGKG